MTTPIAVHEALKTLLDAEAVSAADPRALFPGAGSSTGVHIGLDEAEPEAWRNPPFAVIAPLERDSDEEEAALGTFQTSVTIYVDDHEGNMGERMATDSPDLRGKPGLAKILERFTDEDSGLAYRAGGAWGAYTKVESTTKPVPVPDEAGEIVLYAATVVYTTLVG